MIEAIEICRDFRVKKGNTRTALANVSFKVARGESVALIGPNGAGKTTLVRILSTVLPPTKGEAFVDGYSVTREIQQVRRSLGLLIGTDRGFNNRLNGLDNLIFWSTLYDFSLKTAKTRAQELLSLVGLSDHARLPFMKYSLGMKKKLALARSLISNPQVMILDEPTAGIDVISAINLRSLIKCFAKERTLLFTTHVMKDVEVMADRILFIKDGQLIADHSLESTRKNGSLEDAYVKYIGSASSDIKTSGTLTTIL